MYTISVSSCIRGLFLFSCIIHTHIHKIVVYNCCLSKCGLSFVILYKLSTCLSVHTYIKHFVVQIVSFCPTHTHSIFVDIVVCLGQLCLHVHCKPFRSHTYIHNLLSCLWITYILSICVHTHKYLLLYYNIIILLTVH